MSEISSRDQSGGVAAVSRCHEFPRSRIYDRAEIIADGAIHAAGVALGVVGVIAIALLALSASPLTLTSNLVYGLSLITMLVVSAIYNLWPITHTKWLLRRFDHSAIYLLIAGTYTPFLTLMKGGIAAFGLGIGVWTTALLGMALKLVFPGRFDRLAIALCLALGWSGVLAYDSLASAVPPGALWLLAAGGVLYSIGAVFHALSGLRFHNAIWHGFVLLAATCHYSAVVTCVAAAT